MGLWRCGVLQAPFYFNVGERGALSNSQWSGDGSKDNGAESDGDGEEGRLKTLGRAASSTFWFP